MDKKKLVKRLLRFIPMIIMMAVIFLFSCKQGDESSEQSGKLLLAIVSVVENFAKGGLSPEVLATLHLIIRKVAHFTEYAMLGITALYAFVNYWSNRKYAILPAFLISVLYAATDEVHQYFVPGRYGTPMDVLIDSCGAITGILVVYIVIYSHHGKHDEQR